MQSLYGDYGEPSFACLTSNLRYLIPCLIRQVLRGRLCRLRGNWELGGGWGQRKMGFVESGAPTEPPARGAHDAGHAIAVQCRDLRSWGQAARRWRRWLTLTTRSISNTFTGAAHASQPFGGKPSQSARPASGAGLVWRVLRVIGRGASRPSTSSSSRVGGGSQLGRRVLV
jgi:hypothetical protein